MGSSRSLFPTIFLFILLIIFQVSHSIDDVQFASCPPFSCGNLANISYPFWTDHLDRPAYCGYGNQVYKLKCIGNYQPPVLTINSENFQVLHLNQSHNLMSIKRVNLGSINTSCPEQASIYGVFNYSDSAENITLSYCNITGSTDETFSFCNRSGILKNAFFKRSGDYGEGCGPNNWVEVPVEKKARNELMQGNMTLGNALFQQFDMRYFAFDSFCPQCLESGGRCGSDNDTTLKFVCYCPDNPSQFQCQHHSGKNDINYYVKLGIAIAGGASFLLITCITLFCTRKSFLWKFTKTDRDIEVFLQNNGTLAPKRYSYSDVRKMTNSFKEKLGKGGYGSVYKGKLPNAHFVAVKLLDASKGNGEDFINEVASISRTSHVNIVNLVGFCLDGQKRALIYEYMPNGSLERFICKENTSIKGKQYLVAKELYPIAIGIARGLEYLHRDCNTRIVHFDIKPHNILLDKNFCPKISDFGLAKICTKKESFISMTDARGTIGYIAPEVFCRSVGVASHKSDVYSYGMMIIEMVGGRRNTYEGVSETSEMYFPDWIYRQLEQDKMEMELLGHMSREETEIAKKMIIVGLWCIQTNPADRPSMSKVIEMLDGNIEALEIPPKPRMSSPPRSPVVLDSTTLSSS